MPRLHWRVRFCFSFGAARAPARAIYGCTQYDTKPAAWHGGVFTAPARAGIPLLRGLYSYSYSYAAPVGGGAPSRCMSASSCAGPGRPAAPSRSVSSSWKT